jgi:5-methylcytosine-specific restriction endonuclease McrA
MKTEVARAALSVVATDPPQPSWLEKLDQSISLQRESAALRAAALEELRGLTSEEERHEAMDLLYWEIEDLPVRLIARVLGLPEHASVLLNGIVRPRFLRAKCVRCGVTHECKVISRSRLKIVRNGVMCSDCEAKLELARQEGMRETDKRWAQELKRRSDRLRELRAMPYREYLQTPEWDQTRSAALRRGRGACQACNASGCILHVHHRTYERLGEELASDLIVLCAGCHSLFHKQRELAAA